MSHIEETIVVDLKIVPSRWFFEREKREFNINVEEFCTVFVFFLSEGPKICEYTRLLWPVFPSVVFCSYFKEYFGGIDVKKTFDEW